MKMKLKLIIFLIKYIFKLIWSAIMAKAMPDVNIELTTQQEVIEIFQTFDKKKNLVNLPEGTYPGINYIPPDSPQLAICDQVPNAVDASLLPPNDRYVFTAGNTPGIQTIMVYWSGVTPDEDVTVNFNITIKPAIVPTTDIDSVVVIPGVPELK